GSKLPNGTKYALGYGIHSIYHNYQKGEVHGGFTQVTTVSPENWGNIQMLSSGFELKNATVSTEA
ncbi:MAG: hypothetical protein ACYSTZ_12850, partial [Planctomycetota bacterium]